MQKAQAEIATVVLDIEATHDLTDAEAVRILAQLLDDRGRRLVRDERHPDDADKKGDEA